jgi:predicted amidophosphoribosyltransferase
VPPFVGAFVYMLFRPPEYLEDVRERELEMRAMEDQLGGRKSLCPVCRADVDPSFLVCPICTTRLRQACSGCRSPLDPLWQVCPYCAAPAAPVGPLGAAAPPVAPGDPPEPARFLRRS